MEPTASGEKSVSHISKDGDMNIKPNQASRRPFGMSATVDPPSCLHSPISYNVTLSHGLRSGHFKDQGRVDNFEICFHHCCRDNECDLVFMLRNFCYLVLCYNHESCALKPLVSTANRDLAVAFVYKEHNKELMDWNRASVSHVSPLPVNYQTNEIKNEPNVIDQNRGQISNQPLRIHPNFPSSYQQAKPVNPPNIFNSYPISKQDDQIPQPFDQIAGNKLPSESLPSGLDVALESRSSAHYPKHSLTCIPGPDRYFTTLQGGLNAGYFTDVGFVSNMEICKQYCCQRSDCDAALMQEERCYMVTCPRSELCQDVPAWSKRGITRVSHMFRERRSAVDEGTVVENRKRHMSAKGGVSGFEDQQEAVTTVKNNADSPVNQDIHDFRVSRDGISGIRGEEGVYNRKDIRDNGNNRDNDEIARDIIDVRGNDEFLGGNGLRENGGIHRGITLDGQDARKSSPINVERKDIIPNEVQDKNNDEQVELLRDTIANIKQKKYLQNEEQSHEMRSTSEIPTPPSATKTDFETLFDKDRQDPLRFDDSAGKRQHSLQSEGLGDMASDILSNILRHRAHDSIESIWSHDNDPLQNEITKAREVNTPEKVEKELHQSENKKISNEQGRKVTDGVPNAQSIPTGDNAGMSEASDTMNLNSDTAREGTSSKASGGLDDQSKLIETLYNLVKENSKAKDGDSPTNKGQYNKQQAVSNKETTNKIIDADNSESDTNTVEDEYSDYDDNEGYKDGNSYDSVVTDSFSHKLPIHFQTEQNHRPEMKVNGDDVHYKDNDYDDSVVGKPYDTEIDKDGDNPVQERKETWQSEIGRQRGERERGPDENNYQKLHERKSAEDQENVNRLLDQDLELISDKLREQELQDRNDYNTDDQINDDKFSDYDDNSPDYTDDFSNMDYFDSSGVKRKLLHSRPKAKQWRNTGQRLKNESPNLLENTGNFVASNSNQRKPLVFIEARKPSGQENDNLVMNELEKIEDELSDIKSQPKLEDVVEHTIQKPSSTNSGNPNLMVNSKPDKNSKESIVDILANLKDVGRPDFGNKTGKQNVAKNDENKLVLDELNEIKNQIGNISKSRDASAKAKVSPKVDDIGNEISELLGEDWDLDKRSHIPKPNVKGKLALGGLGPGYHGPRFQSVAKIGTREDTEGTSIYQ